MKFWLYPYNSASAGGKELIKALAGKRIKVAKGRSKWKSNKNKVVINWGSRTFDALNGRIVHNVLNRPEAIRTVADKLVFFRHMAQRGLTESLPAFTVDRSEAIRWVEQGKTVVARTILNGHSGQGIVICAPKGKNEIPEAPLYTRYIPKDQEYRLHILRSRGSDPTYDNFYNQRKVKRASFDGKPNRFVRCFDNGYTYQHNDLEIPPVVVSTAVKVFVESDLHFGAVDVIFCKKENKAYVLEINTAPGLEGASVEKYAQVFKQYFEKS